MKTLLRHADALSTAEAAAVRAAFGAAGALAVEESSGLEWLPVQHNVALTAAIHGTLGDAAFERFFHDHTAAALSTPVFRAVVDGAIALFGLDPSSWARLLPTGWSLVFREVGAWQVERVGRGEVEFMLSGLPQVCLTDPVWPVSVGHSLSALLDLARTKGSMTLTGIRRTTASASYLMRWEVAGGT